MVKHGCQLADNSGSTWLVVISPSTPTLARNSGSLQGIYPYGGLRGDLTEGERNQYHVVSLSL